MMLFIFLVYCTKLLGELNSFIDFTLFFFILLEQKLLKQITFSVNPEVYTYDHKILDSDAH